MAGFDSPYVPGFDCHGLPIEIKVDEQLGRKKLEMPVPAVLAPAAPTRRSMSTCNLAV
jgi:isoleucyl-tRNA synthetase